MWGDRPVKGDGNEKVTGDTPSIRNSLAIVLSGSQEWHILTTVYPESDALNPGGQLLRHVLDRDEDTRSVLSTSKPLAAMWRSPRKQMWLGSSDGYVWTTSEVRWPREDNGGEIDQSQHKWYSMPLPELQGSSLRPNITAIWGSSDSNVFFATASGAIYRWDSQEWSHSPNPGSGSLTKLHGISPDNVYAVGYEATILHWNGNVWRRIKAVDIDADITIITGVAVQRKSGRVFAVTNRGQILHRERDEFVRKEQAAAWFTGLVAWKGELAISSMDGAWLYSEKNGLRKIKENIAATDVMVVRDDLHFIESEQPIGPAVIEYQAKRLARAWQRIIF